jgi:integrase/recombinase XerD
MRLKPVDVMAESKKPKAKAYLELDDVTRLESAATNLRDRLLIRILFHLGCRVSEAIALSVDDIDLKEGTVTIQHLKTRIRTLCPHCSASLGRSHSFCPGCGRKIAQTVKKEQERRRVRTLPLDSITLGMLREYIERAGPVSKNGKKMIYGHNRHRAWQVVKDCADRAGLDDLVNPTTGKKCGISPHRLRDAFAVHEMKSNDSGDGMRLLQVHLGHANFNTTAKYRRVSGAEQKAWYQKLWSVGENDG